jgi:histidine kinase
MFNQLIELCTSRNGLYWLVFGSDLSIALAYFAIPITMAIVLRNHKNDIPYPWLWTLFVTFIVACGLTHAAHVLSVVTGAEYLTVHAAIGLFCAFTSVGTAIAFAFVLPQIRLLPSPAKQRTELASLVAKRTAEKDKLIREINHRVGNQIQIMQSMVSLEERSAKSEESISILNRLKRELDKMAHEHFQYSQSDYLGIGVGEVDGSITPVSDASVPDARSLFSRGILEG